MTRFHDRAFCNHGRLQAAALRGHYESYFQRANHDTRPLAFWIRYTVLVPRAAPERGVGELWAIYFDGERGRTVAVKERHPLASCAFSERELDARIASATLQEGRLQGRARSAGAAIGWQLEYACEEPPLLLLPERLYDGGFPKAKSLVGSPGALVGLAGVSTVLVDLSKSGALEALPAIVASGTRVVAYGSHVDRTLLDAAREAGVAEVLPRSAFFTRLPSLLRA